MSIFLYNGYLYAQVKADQDYISDGFTMGWSEEEDLARYTSKQVFSTEEGEKFAYAITMGKIDFEGEIRNLIQVKIRGEIVLKFHYEGLNDVFSLDCPDTSRTLHALNYLRAECGIVDKNVLTTLSQRQMLPTKNYNIIDVETLFKELKEPQKPKVD